MYTSFVRDDWEFKAKQKLAKEIGCKNIEIRAEVFQTCINEATFYVSKLLNVPMHNIYPYYSPITDSTKCEQFLQWVYGLKIPNSKGKALPKKVFRYNDVECALHKSYDYRKSRHFGDHFFPHLMNSAINYAVSLSQNLNFKSTGQQEAYQSILIKFYWWYVLKASIVSFRQTKPTPLICLRSINNKIRILNQLLKQFISENEMKYVLEKHNITMSYDTFPTTPLIAAMVIQMLANEESIAYQNTYLNNCNDCVDEENAGNNNYNTSRYLSHSPKFYDISNTDNNYANSMSNVQDERMFNQNYTWNQTDNFNRHSQECRFDPIGDDEKQIKIIPPINHLDEELYASNNCKNPFMKPYIAIRNDDKNHHDVIDITNSDDIINNWDNCIDMKNNNDNDNSYDSSVVNVDVFNNIFDNDVYYNIDNAHHLNTTDFGDMFDNGLNDMSRQSSFDEHSLPPFANFTFNSEFVNNLRNS